MKFTNILQIATYFYDDKVCNAHFEKLRWPSGKPCCPFCKSEKVYRTRKAFICGEKDCLKKFSAKVGTIFENTKIPLQKWFMAIFLATSHKKGISSIQLSKDISVTQKTAWFMLHRIRELYKEQNPTQLSGTIEIDETYIGGSISNQHLSKRVKRVYKKRVSQGRSIKEKEPVLGIVERGGRIVLKHIPNAQKVSIQPLIAQYVKPGSTIYTDEYSLYGYLATDYTHANIQHRLEQYVDGDVHTNTVEGSFGLLKNGLRGVQHHVSPKHLQRYLNEFSYKYSTRSLKDGERFDLCFQNVHGRLKYIDLVGKKTPKQRFKF